MSQTLPPEGSSTKKIQEIQELDKWRAEQTCTVPIELSQLDLGECNSEDELKIEVATSSHASWSVHLTCGDLQQFCMDLQEAFPVEAGQVGKHKRILPRFDLPKPKKSLFGGKIDHGAQVEQVRKQVSTLLAEILKLPSYILQSRVVISCFARKTGKEDQVGQPTERSSVMPEKSLKKHKLKLRMGDEIAMIHLVEDAVRLEELMKQVETKLAPSQPYRSFWYVDDEGDRVMVEDDEDLRLALLFFPSNLNLTLTTNQPA